MAVGVAVAVLVGAVRADKADGEVGREEREEGR